MAAGPTSGEIRQAQEAMARHPNAAPVVQGVVEDLGAAGVQAGLERAAMRQPSFTAINNLRENNFGHVDAQGNRQYHGNEQQLDQQAQTRIDMIQNLINQGFDAMPAPQRNQILADVSQAILQTPEMRTRFANLNLAQQTVEADRMAREYLRDPNFRSTIVDLLMQRTDLTRPIADNVSETAHKLEEARAERGRLTQANTGDLARAEGEVTSATNRLRQYQQDPNPPANGQPQNGRFYDELNAQVTARDTARTRITNLENNTIPNHENTVAQLEAEERSVVSLVSGYEPRKHLNPNFVPQNPPIANDPAQYLTPEEYLASIGMRSLVDVRASLTAERNQLRGARQSLATEKSNQTAAESRITQINDEKTRAETALKEAQAGRDKIQTRINDLDKEINSNNAKFLKDQGDRERQQTAWVSELDNIIRDATAARVHEEMPIAIQKLKDRLTEDAKNTKDAQERIVLDRLTRRYFNDQNEAQRNVIDQDFTVLMHAGQEMTFNWPDPNNAGQFIQRRIFLNGAEQALARVLGAGTPGFTYQDAERVYNLMNNAEFRNANAPRVAQEILTARLFTGRLSRNEVLAIERSTWGPGMVARALEGKTNLQAAVDKLVGKGVLNWGDNLVEQLKKIEWSKFAMILLILAGVIGGISLLKKG